jgi:hypothetical protein
MPPKNRLVLVSLLMVLAALLVIALAPVAVSHGVRLWIWLAGRREGLIATVEKIDAPFLRPVTIRQLRLNSRPENALRLDVTIADAVVDLNFKHILLHTRGRAVRSLSIRDLRVKLRRANPNLRAISQNGWSALHRLLPESLSVAAPEIRVENGPTLLLARNGFLSASETEPGRLSAAEILIASPWFHQTFWQLRGATHWEANRLTMAGLTLSRGLDLESATMDLSRLSNQHVGLQFELDAFGGKIRGNIWHQWHSQHPSWKIAGAAGDISLAQTSDAFGFADRVSGLLHNGNFTFRGNLDDPDRATASLWIELTGLTWRNRTAEAIMLGAALYNRKIQLQQLYIKQKNNQFTLGGEAALPAHATGWLSPDFRGNISASINQLGDFAALFGANPGDFAGTITVEGAMDTRDRKFGGHLVLDGATLTLFKTAIDTFNAKLNLKGSELEIEQLKLARKNDSLEGQGKFSLSPGHNYSGVLTVNLADLTDYANAFFERADNNRKPAPATLQATIDSSIWNARGTVALPGSSLVNFTGKFPLPIEVDWKSSLASALNLTLDFPCILLAKAPKIFPQATFRDGILSGNISISGTLRHPRIAGEMQLLNGKPASAGFFPATIANLAETSGRITFGDNRASLDFLNVKTQNADLSLRGEIDFQDTGDLMVRMSPAMPLFDLTLQPMDCVSAIEIQQVSPTLAPPVTEIEFRGGLFQSNWTIALAEQPGAQSVVPLTLTGPARKLPLCSDSGAGEKTLSLGVLPWPEAGRETVRPKKRAKSR